MEDLLERNPEARLRVLVVWEPILPMDWSSPGRLVGARISDPRVVQFWDRQHLVSQELSKQFDQPGCCRHDGVLWDFAALYPRNEKWGTAAPGFVGGPVVEAKEGIAARLTELTNQSSRPGIGR
jgi:hypothetical protein